ncbi:MAG TPA: hypothetical protein VGW37_14555 [Terriglobia bacterium]|nr:hypothetical protein [Terriglobia bacterium]
MDPGERRITGKDWESLISKKDDGHKRCSKKRYKQADTQRQGWKQQLDPRGRGLIAGLWISGWRTALNLQISSLNFRFTAPKEKKEIGHEKAQKEHCEAGGCIFVGRASELGMDLQKPHEYEREQRCPKKRKAKNGFISPDDRGDNRGNNEGHCDFSQVCFLGTGPSCNHRL